MLASHSTIFNQWWWSLQCGGGHASLHGVVCQPVWCLQCGMVWWWTCQPVWCGVPACVVAAVQCGVVVDMPVCVGLEISTIVYHHRGDNNPLINSMWKSVNIKLQTIGRHPVGKEEQERFARLPIRRLQPSRGSSCSWSKRVGQVQEGPNKI